MVRKWMAVLVLALMFFVMLSKVLGVDEGSFERIFSFVGYPFLVLQKSVRSLLVSGYSRTSFEKLIKEYEDVVRERDKLSCKVAELSGFVRNFQDTKELREYGARFSQHGIYAPVLMRNFSGQHFFLLDVGSHQGVKKGMIALSKEALIGKVTEVYPLYSKIVLITDPSCKIASYCSSNGVKGIHEGLKSGMTTLNFVDPRHEILAGDLVLSSGEGGLFPRGFVLSKVTHSDSSRYGRSLVMSPVVDLSKIDYCLLLKSPVEVATLSLNNDFQESDKLS